MPDPNQRAAYLIHIRDGFQRRVHLPSNSRESLLAYRDGVDQVEQMEYYHSQMKMKQNEKRPIINSSTSVPNSSKNETGYLASSANANIVIARWLLNQLPHLNQGDVIKYSQHLIDDGFDSVVFIEEELIDEDLSFMKKAHQRVIGRQLRERRDCDGAGE